MKSSIAPALLALALGALPLAASSQQLAYTAKAVNLRAGPDRYYPVIAVLPPAAPVSVYGCLADYRWCDVSSGYDRGWVYAGNLSYPYQGGYVVFPGIAPIIGIAVLGFVLDDYWYLHYHDRPFYGQRHRYERPPPRYPAPHQAYPAPRPAYPTSRPAYPTPPAVPYPSARPGIGAPAPAPGGHAAPPTAHPGGRPAPPHGQPQPQPHQAPPQRQQGPQGHERGEPPGHGDRPAPPGQRDRP